MNLSYRHSHSSSRAEDFVSFAINTTAEWNSHRVDLSVADICATVVAGRARFLEETLVRFYDRLGDTGRITYRETIIVRSMADPITPAATLEIVRRFADWNRSWSGGGEADETGEHEADEVHFDDGSVRCFFER